MGSAALLARDGGREEPFCCDPFALRRGRFRWVLLRFVSSELIPFGPWALVLLWSMTMLSRACLRPFEGSEAGALAGAWSVPPLSAFEFDSPFAAAGEWVGPDSGPKKYIEGSNPTRLPSCKTSSLVMPCDRSERTSRLVVQRAVKLVVISNSW